MRARVCVLPHTGAFVLSKYKSRQLCRQVQRALNLALAERGSDPGLEQLYVVDVTSDLGCGHLFAHFSIGAALAARSPGPFSPPKSVVFGGCELAEVLASLQREAPRLRAQVARAICRKRAPALTFIPALVQSEMTGGGGRD